MDPINRKDPINDTLQQMEDSLISRRQPEDILEDLEEGIDIVLDLAEGATRIG